MDNKINTRNIALNMLIDTTEKGDFSHITVNKAFSETKPDKQARAFVGRLYSGTLEQLIFLDYVINQYSSVNTQKMKPFIRNVLRLSVYQLLFMEAVPAHAAISEALILCENRGYKSLKPFVNGVLRAIQRGGVPENIPDNVKKSAPKWLFELVIKDYGKEDAERFFDAVNSPKEYVWARLNLKSESKGNIIELLKADGCEICEDEKIDEAVQLKNFSPLSGLKAFQKGLIFIQDYSSMNIADMAEKALKNKKALKYKKGKAFLVLDVCAAPGGKSLHMSEKFPDSFVYARDISRKKTDIIDENIKRMKSDNVKSQIWDALKTDEAMIGKADIVIADLPCSGLGVIGQKPDIKLRVKQKDLEELEKLQKNILDVVSGYVHEGGILIYSTCTVNKKENEENVKWLLENKPFELIEVRSFLPGRNDCDGFFAALLKRI